MIAIPSVWEGRSRQALAVASKSYYGPLESSYKNKYSPHFKYNILFIYIYWARVANAGPAFNLSIIHWFIDSLIEYRDRNGQKLGICPNSMTSKVFYIAVYLTQQCALHSFEQLEAICIFTNVTTNIWPNLISTPVPSTAGPSESPMTINQCCFIVGLTSNTEGQH